tara:strand:- start:272 stop:445 length:174 start_codon:yes stop_codon:yes gene_type:complete
MSDSNLEEESQEEEESVDKSELVDTIKTEQAQFNVEHVLALIGTHADETPFDPGIDE